MSEITYQLSVSYSCLAIKKHLLTLTPVFQVLKKESKRISVDTARRSALKLVNLPSLKDRFTVQRMLVNQNAIFLPVDAISSMKAICSCHNVVKKNQSALSPGGHLIN